jgi:hypothetical protein
VTNPRRSALQDHPALRLLEPDEEIHVQAQAGDSVLIVTSRRLAVGSLERLALDVPIDNIRRIQFDIERDRPATLVIVPHEAHGRATTSRDPAA